MIPLYKLEQLPRSQRLRKILKSVTEAEIKLCRGGSLTAGELEHLAGMAAILLKDPFFPQAALAGTKAAVFQNAAEIFSAAVSATAVSTIVAAETDDKKSGLTTGELRRAVNGIRHLLITEMGRTAADWDMVDSGGFLDPAQRRIFSGMEVYLEDIRSPFNIGAMFRSAESFGAEKIYLSPFCADPNHPRSQRTAMGCATVLSWERRELFPPAADSPVFAMETGGIPLEEFPFPDKGLLIAGSEELGVSPPALAAADASLGRVSIPCYGAKGSLNVSVAFGIVMQAWAAALDKTGRIK